MTKELRRGDRVSWNSHGSEKGAGKATGTVVRKLVEPTTVKGHHAKASRDDPQFLVESDHGGRAAHNPAALQREPKTISGTEPIQPTKRSKSPVSKDHSRSVAKDNEDTMAVAKQDRGEHERKAKTTPVVRRQRPPSGTTRPERRSE